MDYITLKDWAIAHGIDPATARQRAGRGACLHGWPVPSVLPRPKIPLMTLYHLAEARW